MDKRKLKSGFTTILPGSLRMGEWVTVPTGQRRCSNMRIDPIGNFLLDFDDDAGGMWYGKAERITVNYPRPRTALLINYAHRIEGPIDPTTYHDDHTLTQPL